MIDAPLDRDEPMDNASNKRNKNNSWTFVINIIALRLLLYLGNRIDPPPRSHQDMSPRKHAINLEHQG